MSKYFLKQVYSILDFIKSEGMVRANRNDMFFMDKYQNFSVVITDTENQGPGSFSRNVKCMVFDMTNPLLMLDFEFVPSDDFVIDGFVKNTTNSRKHDRLSFVLKNIYPDIPSEEFFSGNMSKKTLSGYLAEKKDSPWLLQAEKCALYPLLFEHGADMTYISDALKGAMDAIIKCFENCGSLYIVLSCPICKTGELDAIYKGIILSEYGLTEQGRAMGGFLNDSR